MGNKKEMQERISDKLNQGFRVLKLKVGALDFDDEISLLKSIRDEFPPISWKYGWMPMEPLTRKPLWKNSKGYQNFIFTPSSNPLKPGNGKLWHNFAGNLPYPLPWMRIL
jgi:hypothetical protein